MSGKPAIETTSWLDHLFRRIEALPFKPWVTYLLLYFGFVISFQLIAWLDGLRALGDFSITTFFNPVWVPAGLAGIHYLNTEGRRALKGFRPVMDTDEEEFRMIQTQMSTIPQPVVLSIQALVGLALFLVARTNPARLSSELQPGTATLWFAVIFMTLGFSNLFIYFYQTFRRLKLVSRVYSMVKQINIFEQQPLYTLSAFNVKIGFVWILFMNLNIVAFVLQTGPQATTFPLMFIEILLVILVFLFPAWGIHNRIQRAKEVLLTENGRQLEATNSKLNISLQENEHKDIVTYEKGVAALVSMRNEIGKSPTWPWDIGTFRSFLSAVLLPILLFVIQQFLVGYL